MNVTVHPSSLCRCGEVGTPLILAAENGDVCVMVCDTCRNQTFAELDQVRPVFNAMIKAGVDRGVANEVMSVLLDRIHYRDGKRA